jgi:hypothetical protein
VQYCYSKKLKKKLSINVKVIPDFTRIESAYLVKRQFQSAAEVNA